MNMIEDRLRAAAQAAADTIPAGSAPPLRLGQSRRGTGPILSGFRGRGLAARLAVPLAAAAAVVAVIATSVAIAGAGGPGAAAPSPAPRMDSVPPYYGYLPASGTVQVRDTHTGATLATFRAARGFAFVRIAEGGDARTFALAADATRLPKACRKHPGLAICTPAEKLFIARFDPAHRSVSQRALAVPEIHGFVSDLAVSPDGSELAADVGVALTHGQYHEQVRVYSVATGTAKAWTPPGPISEDVPALSWGSHGVLAFSVWEGKPAHEGIWLLNTNAPAGTMLAAARLAVPEHQPGQFSAQAPFALSADGKTIALVVVRQRSKQHYIASEFRWYSAVTGREIRSYWPSPNYDESVLWSNSSGSVLVVTVATKEYSLNAPGMLAVLSGHRLIPLARAPSEWFSIAF